MRLFIAINFDTFIKNEIMNTIHMLKESGVQGSFSQRQHLHLTLVFIGETKRVQQVKWAMDSVQYMPFTLSIQKLGTFSKNYGSILWAGVDENIILFSIQADLVNALSKQDFKIEKRPYKPHLTLGRKIQLPANSKSMFAKVPFQLQSDVHKISLMKSERVQNQLVYTEIYAKNF